MRCATGALTSVRAVVCGAFPRASSRAAVRRPDCVKDETTVVNELLFQRLVTVYTAMIEANAFANNWCASLDPGTFLRSPRRADIPVACPWPSTASSRDRGWCEREGCNKTCSAFAHHSVFTSSRIVIDRVNGKSPTAVRHRAASGSSKCEQKHAWSH